MILGKSFLQKGVTEELHRDRFEVGVPGNGECDSGGCWEPKTQYVRAIKRIEMVLLGLIVQQHGDKSDHVAFYGIQD